MTWAGSTPYPRELIFLLDKDKGPIQIDYSVIENNPDDYGYAGACIVNGDTCVSFIKL